MTHVKALQAGHSSQGTSEPITPAVRLLLLWLYYTSSKQCTLRRHSRFSVLKDDVRVMR